MIILLVVYGFFAIIFASAVFYGTRQDKEKMFLGRGQQISSCVISGIIWPLFFVAYLADGIQYRFKA